MLKEYDNIIGKKPKDYTEKDIEEAILYLLENKTFKEIRKFQNLNYQQCQLAYRGNKDEVLQELHIMADIYTSVIMRMSFQFSQNYKKYKYKSMKKKKKKIIRGRKRTKEQIELALHNQTGKIFIDKKRVLVQGKEYLDALIKGF